jgi:cytochrome c oxidase cbb3-type subunit 3
MTIHRSLRPLMPALFVWALAFTACSRPPGDLRQSSTPPPGRTPIGPIPGRAPGSGDNVARVANPFADDRGAIGAGRRIFTGFNCAGCHGEHAGGGMGPSLRDADWVYGNTDAQIFGSITEGRAHGMPAWQSKLTEDQTWRLVAYIKSLRTRNEPEPPI